jgi:hypothetical protein
MYGKTLAVLLLTTVAGTALGDTLLIEGVQNDAQSASSRPARGQSMERVEAQFGAPTQRSAAIGEPPISRWEYPGFTVFFEHQHVIHSVVRH